ncbi:MAG TPA: hypothetical protein VK808_02635 [Bacteroidia bacterium]|nr:hypothetical protein [Bacteroidia bacterium]
MYDHSLRILKNIIGLLAIIYFFVPVIIRFLIIKTHSTSTPSIVTKFLSLSIFQPVLQQYDIALAKNSAIYYLAFLVGLLLICWLCWLIVFYVAKMIYLGLKRL